MASPAVARSRIDRPEDAPSRWPLAKSIGVRGALADRLHVASLLAEREVQTLVRGIGGYVALTVALVAVAWLSAPTSSGRASSLLVHHNPFRVPLLAATLVLSVFLAISAVVSVARERERGTLEAVVLRSGRRAWVHRRQVRRAGAGGYVLRPAAPAAGVRAARARLAGS